MEEGDAMRLSPLRPVGGSLMSPSSRKSSPRVSPSFRRLNSGRTPRQEVKSGGISYYWFGGNRVVLWLLLITLWAYAGFYFQSRWAHGDNKEDLFSGGYGGESSGKSSEPEKKKWRNLIATPDSMPVLSGKSQESLENVNVALAKNPVDLSRNKKTPAKKKSKRGSHKKSRGKPKVIQDIETRVDIQEEEIPTENTTYGSLVGPFGSLEDTILGWSPETRSGTCDRKGAFARLVWSRKFVLIFHELSMTGAPLAMMELASEFLSCGATVSAIVLNKNGGLMPELARRKIKVLEGKTDLSFKTAMRANLIIAGSAVCSSWIEQYLSRTVLGSSQIMWWIMENRREYFDRSKLVLNRVKKVIFISESQSKQWLAWCDEEKIHLNSEPSLIPLSVNDGLAFVSGISCSLNTPSFSTETMQEKRRTLRTAVRREMGLNDDDMLVVSLSSINPGKGQLLLLESARLMVEKDPLQKKRLDPKDPLFMEHDYYSRALLQDHSSTFPVKSEVSDRAAFRKLSSESHGHKEKHLKILIGSVGSKSNKVPYVRKLLTFLSTGSNLSKSVMWTPATTRVASLYAASDVYVMNSQGLGETFGRVTIEAMAFGLPVWHLLTALDPIFDVLGTDAGGTREIVDHNVTGLLHPLGRPGAAVLARNLEFLLENPSARQEMGNRGREKVEKMYLKKHMYQKFGEVLYKCMRIK